MYVCYVCYVCRCVWVCVFGGMERGGERVRQTNPPNPIATTQLSNPTHTRPTHAPTHLVKLALERIPHLGPAPLGRERLRGSGGAAAAAASTTPNLLSRGRGGGVVIRPRVTRVVRVLPTRGGGCSGRQPREGEGPAAAAAAAAAGVGDRGPRSRHRRRLMGC
jgi:hypothetical protein